MRGGVFTNATCTCLAMTKSTTKRIRTTIKEVLPFPLELSIRMMHQTFSLHSQSGAQNP